MPQALIIATNSQPKIQRFLGISESILLFIEFQIFTMTRLSKRIRGAAYVMDRARYLQAYFATFADESRGPNQSSL